MTRVIRWIVQDVALSIQCVCTAMVALGAAYASFRHGREFALRSGADTVTASIWPLLVDGLLTIATVELWKTHRGGRASGRWVAWLAFGFGICLSLVANIGSAPMLSVLQVTVAACPPLVLLLAVELLNGALKRRTDTDSETGSETARAERQRDESSLDGDHSIETSDVVRLISVPTSDTQPDDGTAEQRMWAHYTSQTTAGHTPPSGAELDRVTTTDDRILRQWRAANKIPRQPQLATAATAD